MWNYVGYFFFQGPIGRDIKTSVKIRNIFFAAISLHSRRSDVDIFRSMVPSFQYPRRRSQPAVLSANSIRCVGLQLAVPKCCPPKTVSYEERDENHRELSPGGWWWAIKHFPLKTLQEPLSCSCSVRFSIVMKKDNTWGQHSSSLVLK